MVCVGYDLNAMSDFDVSKVNGVESAVLYL